MALAGRCCNPWAPGLPFRPLKVIQEIDGTKGQLTCEGLVFPSELVRLSQVTSQRETL